MRTVTISMPKELADKVTALCKQEHRSFSKQVAFFCAQGVRDLKGEEVEQSESEAGE